MSNFELAVEISNDLLSRGLIMQDYLSEVESVIEDFLDYNNDSDDNYPILI